MKKLWGLIVIVCLFSCSDDDEIIEEGIPLAPASLKQISHEIAEEVEQLRNIPRVEGHTLRIDTAAYFEDSDESQYFGELYEPMKQSGFFTPITHRVALPDHWPTRYKYWDGEVGGYFSPRTPDDIHLVLPSNDPNYLGNIMVKQENLKTLAHEYTHLLQNQKGLLDLITITDIRSLSRDLLIAEGDATFMMDLWGSKYTTGSVNLDSVIEFEKDEINTFEYYLGYNALSDFYAFLLSHYMYGTIHVAEAYKAGGAEAINALYTDETVTLSELVTGRKEPLENQDPTIYSDLFLPESNLFGTSIGAFMTSVLLNRSNPGTKSDKMTLFQKQYSIISDRYFFAKKGEYYQSIWNIRFSDYEDALFAEMYFQLINIKGNGTSRPIVSLVKSFTEGDFQIKEYKASTFSTYLVLKDTELWIIDNPLVHITTVLEYL